MAVCVVPLLPMMKFEFVQLVVFKLPFCCKTNPVNDDGHERITFVLAITTLNLGAWVGPIEVTVP